MTDYLADCPDVVAIAGFQSGFGNHYRERDYSFDAKRGGHYSTCVFSNCKIKMAEGTTDLTFVNCVFLDCTFDPPFPPFGDGLGEWAGRIPDSVVLFHGTQSR